MGAGLAGGLLGYEVGKIAGHASNGGSNGNGGANGVAGASGQNDTNSTNPYGPRSGHEESAAGSPPTVLLWVLLACLLVGSLDYAGY